MGCLPDQEGNLEEDHEGHHGVCMPHDTLAPETCTNSALFTTCITNVTLMMHYLRIIRPHDTRAPKTCNNTALYTSCIQKVTWNMLRLCIVPPVCVISILHHECDTNDALFTH